MKEEANGPLSSGPHPKLEPSTIPYSTLVVEIPGPVHSIFGAVRVPSRIIPVCLQDYSRVPSSIIPVCLQYYSRVPSSIIPVCLSVSVLTTSLVAAPSTAVSFFEKSIVRRILIRTPPLVQLKLGSSFHCIGWTPSAGPLNCSLTYKTEKTRSHIPPHWFSRTCTRRDWSPDKYIFVFVKEQVKPVQGFYAIYASQLPVWDDDQILTENWGTALSAVSGASASAGGKEPKQGKGGKEGGLTGNCFVDLEGRLPLERFIERHLPREELAPSQAVSEEAAAAPPAEERKNASKDPKKGKTDKKDKGETPERDSPVAWHRPVDVSKPFRPVVHRNATPFVNPYATDDDLTPIDAKEEEAKYRAEAAQQVSGGKKGDAQKVETGGPIFELYPETVSLMEDLVGQSASHWQGIRSEVAVQRYREIPPLMEPYDPTLVSGCAETPAEACGSRYSTALRHKLQRAETLEALRKIPPFLMSAFNSVLLVMEKVQQMIQPGHYVWELIYPHAPGTCHPVYNPFGKYAVKLFVEGSYRKVIVDDALPVDELGRPLITVTSLRELWPAILVKAIFKAFGNDAARFFTDDPDLLVPCLMGNYVPQYVQVKQDMLGATALLLTYKLQLEAAATKAGKPRMSPDRSATPGRREKEKSIERLGHSGSSPPPTSRKRSISKKGAKKEVTVTNGAERLTAEEFEPPNDDEPIDRRPRILCGMRTTRSDPPPPGFGSGTQLFAVTDVLNFRNTVAVRVETTPRSDLRAGVFEREREAKDVRNILHAYAVPQDANKDQTKCSVWLTLEELGEAMDCVVVWRNFDQRYLHQISMEYDASNIALPAAGGGAGGKKSSAAAAAALAAAGPPVVRAPKRHTVMWLSLSSDRPEEVAVVAYGPVPPPPLTAEEEAAAAEAANPKKAPPHAKQSKQASSKRGAAAVEPPPPPEEVEPPNINSASSTGCPTSWVNYDCFRKESKLIQLEYYQYDLSDPLTQSLTTVYEYGKLSSTVFKLRPGTHLFRVTVPEMEYGDKVTFVSDARLAVQTELNEALKSVMVHSISDAGVYPPIHHPNKESVWFKRKIKVATTTNLSIVLSTLLPTENPVQHRNVTVSAAPARAAKGAGGASSSARGAAAGKGPTGPPAGEELDLRRCDVPIIKYATIMVIDLDNRHNTLVGSGGQLIQVSLEANRAGYLLVAYACVPASEVPKIRDGYETPAAGEKTSAHAESQDGDQSPTPSPTPAGTEEPLADIYGRGLWKVSLRSDSELAAFEALTHSAHVLTDSNTLERGGGAVFFRHTCTVTEPTHLSLVAEMVESFNIPVTFSITHHHSVPAASTAGGKTEPSTMEMPLDVDACLYQSPAQMSHLFIPDVLLELVEKAKSSTYLIEGKVPAEKAEAWDEYCRQAQADKFHLIRQDAQRATEERRAKDVEDAANDPAGFIQQKMEEQQMQQQQQQALEADRASKEGNANQKRNRSVDRRKPAGQNARRGSRSSISHEAPQKLVSTSAASSLLGPLDAVDKDLHITHHVQLIFSNPKTELKNALPQEDCLALLRQHWRDTAAPPNAVAQDLSGSRPVSGPPVNPKTTSPVSSKTTRQQQQQREQAAAEELQRSEQGRQSRLHFIENPLNALVPYVQVPEETVGRSHPKGGNQPMVISEDTEENNFMHAPPFDESAHRIRLLPIRGYEMTAPTAVEAALLAPSASNAFTGNQSARENRRGRNGATKASTPPSSQWNPSTGTPQWDEDDAQIARGPLVQLTERLTDVCREQREEQKKGRKEVKRRIYHYWSARPSQTEEGAAPGVYPSLIGNRDDDSVPRQLRMENIQIVFTCCTTEVIIEKEDDDDRKEGLAACSLYIRRFMNTRALERSLWFSLSLSLSVALPLFVRLSKP
eukprot:gene13321-9157_t